MNALIGLEGDLFLFFLCTRFSWMNVQVDHFVSIYVLALQVPFSFALLIALDCIRWQRQKEGNL